MRVRWPFILAFVFVVLVVAIIFGVQLYRAKCEVIDLERQVWNMESELRIAKVKACK